MSVKVIATDMDGTFLNSKGSYDHNRFQRILKQLQKKRYSLCCRKQQSIPSIARTLS